MAKRPIFISDTSSEKYITEVEVEFEFYNGFSLDQKQKSIKSLHEAAKSNGINDLLEVSTKSPNELGNLLSAFNLSFLDKNNKIVYLESIFQGSKVFENDDGPHKDLYRLFPQDVKKDSRIDRNKKITKFEYEGQIWESEPKTAFYDWIYLNALKFNIDNSNNPIYKKILNFSAFTDIEFNPKKSINCQARSCALFVSLYKKDKLEIALESKESFLDTISIDNFYKKKPTQGTLDEVYNI